jgi:hypothetical protein
VIDREKVARLHSEKKSGAQIALKLGYSIPYICRILREMDLPVLSQIERLNGKFMCGHSRTPENTRKDGCKICRRKEARSYHQKNAEKLNSIQRCRSRSFRANYREEANERTRRKRYGDNAVKHYNKQMASQGGLCSICSTVMEKPQQDHAPYCCPPKINKRGRRRSRSCGKCLRGLLCMFCNSRLGYVEQILLDNPNLILRDRWLRKAQSYLFKWKEIHAHQKVS